MASETLDQLWPGHKEKYNELNKSLIRTTISIPRIENSMEREETIRRAQRRIGEIEELLEIMRADLRSVPPRMPQWRSHFMSEYREFTDNFKQNKQEFELALTKHRFMDMNVCFATFVIYCYLLLLLLLLLLTRVCCCCFIFVFSQ